MRHGKRINHLGRTAPHRKATLSNLASSLLLHKRINTTLAKARELRKYVEPLITKAKVDSTHTRRVVFSYLQDKESVKALYNEVVDRVGERPGGYTRIIKLGSRLGDNAEMAMIELVDFNEFLLEEDAGTKKSRTRRSRRGKGTSETDDAKVSNKKDKTKEAAGAEAPVSSEAIAEEEKVKEADPEKEEGNKAEVTAEEKEKETEGKEQVAEEKTEETSEKEASEEKKEESEAGGEPESEERKDDDQAENDKEEKK